MIPRTPNSLFGPLALMLVMIPALAYGQRPALDSLKQVLDTAQEAAIRLQTYDALIKPMAFPFPDSALHYGLTGLTEALVAQDTIRAASLSLNIGTAYYAKNANQDAFKYWQQAVDLSRRTQEMEILPLALNNVAAIYKSRGDIDQAIEIFEQIREVYLQRNDSLRYGRATFNMGSTYFRVGNDSLGEYYVLQSIEWYKQVGRRANANIGNAYNELGVQHYRKGKFLEALELYQPAIDYFLQGGDTLRSVIPRNNIANIHLQLNNLDLAEETLLEIIQIREKQKQGTVHYNYNNLGLVYKEMERDSLSLYFLQKAYTMRKSGDLQGMAASSAELIGNLFEAKGELDSAKAYYQESLSLAERGQHEENQINALLALGGWEIKHGEEDVGAGLLEQALARAKAVGLQMMISNAAQGLHAYYAGQEEYQKAYQMHSLYNQLSDSLFNADLVRETALQESRFAYDKELLQKEAELQLSEEAAKNARLRSLLYLVLGLGVILGGGLIVRIVLLRKEQKRRALEQLGEFREAMTGMIAHDLKNPLSVIINQSNPEAPPHHMAQQMLRLINNMLDVHKMETTEVVPDPQALPLLSLVMRAADQVQPLVEEKNLKLNLDISTEAVVQADPSLLDRVFINFLTNAIKFSPQNRTLTVSARAVAAGYQVSIGDEGVGIPKDQWKSIFESFGQVEARHSGGIGSTGLGLTFCKLALAAHGADIQIDSTVGVGTTFSFVLPKCEATVATPAHKSPASEDRPKIAQEDWNRLRGLLPELKTLAVYEAVAIEAMLDKLQAEGQEETRQWVASVLNAAYTGNQAHYDAILSDVGEVLP